MATALMLWSSTKEIGVEDKEKKPENELSPPEMNREIVRTKGKRNGKSNATAQKRQPQRGLGVAQLERLRLQERWRKITEIQPPQPQNLHLQYAFPFVDPRIDNSYTRFAIGALNESQSSTSQNSILPRYWIGNGGGDSSLRCIYSDQISLDRFQIGPHEARFQRRNQIAVAEMARELSSTENTNCISDQCEFCIKKKRLHGQNSRFKSGRFGEIATEGCDFLDLNLGPRSIDGKSNDSSGRGERRADSSRLHAAQAVEAVAVQRKGKLQAECERGIMEYEFFPPKSNSSSSISGFPVSAHPKVGEASSSSSSNFLDLSLKLSG
ncbi:uncharacterized protein LOC143846525 [Tasmannia lanceolata]|uniref:uncharacterized protein LOC143846525 n=1 Tax=Tasmannia lanceolata TaxID=3420 RepID=UPI0040635CEA